MILSRTLRNSILCCALLAATRFSTPCLAQPAASAPMSREEAVLITITASIQAINQNSREVTLKGPLGNTVTFTVDPAVKRLTEFKVGDMVRADYYLGFAAELRKPTPEEEKVPFSILDTAGKAPPTASPGAGGLRRFKVVTTVEGLDRPTQTVTVKGPLGNYLTARVLDPARLTQLRIGDSIVLVCTEAFAVSLDKAEPKAAN